MIELGGTTKSPFEDVYLKLSRASEHIAELDRLIKDYFATSKWQPVVERDDANGRFIHKARFGSGFSNRIRVISADAFGNLRSTLDLLVAACARCLGEQRNRKIYFPFSKNAEQWEKDVERNLSILPPAVIAYFRSLAPYQGGDNYVYGLSLARNDSEHWQLTNVSIFVLGMQTVFKDPALTKMLDVRSFVIGEVDEVTLFSSDDPAVRYGLSSLLSVRFDGVDQFGNSEPMYVLNYLSDKIRKTIEDVERFFENISSVV